MKITKGKTPKARRMMIYGENGSGKSTLASHFPKPVFLNLEDGLNDIDCAKTDRIITLGDYQNALVELYYSDYQTIVTDTVDWLEKLIFSVVAAKAGKQTIDDIGFGKGYQAVEALWQGLLVGYTALWNQGRHVVFTCHETIDKFANPDGDSFNFWRPSLHLKGSGCVSEWCDEVLFLKKKTIVIGKDEGFGKVRGVAMDGGRVIVTSKQATCEAKNRLGLAPEVAHSFDSLGLAPVKLLVENPTASATANPSGNIVGLVADGSSNVVGSVADSIDSPF